MGHIIFLIWACTVVLIVLVCLVGYHVDKSCNKILRRIDKLEKRHA